MEFLECTHRPGFSYRFNLGQAVVTGILATEQPAPQPSADTKTTPEFTDAREYWGRSCGGERLR
ncbi:hypothetical protein HZF08_38805 [Paenibacillus sp. CGMCC 1.16610]|uniref:hypothetical protein n=1 Tax=Paenibacillus anseongense TaxID=2682845 RepID=UPI001626B2E7|nr:hypothetical protein [Paenibacillus anseongense]MBA2944230.1 hypothetical protein [Paenibacillus sp. CGMCC 1.16610]